MPYKDRDKQLKAQREAMNKKRVNPKSVNPDVNPDIPPLPERLRICWLRPGCSLSKENYIMAMKAANIANAWKARPLSKEGKERY